MKTKIPFLAVIAFIVLLPLSSLGSECYSSGGGTGDAWLSGQVTAGGVGVEDIAVYLQPAVWEGENYYYAYETACTDGDGNFEFRKQLDPATECYSTYSFYDYGLGDYISTSYCNWNSAQCYQQCVLDDVDGYYSGFEFVTEGYELVAMPPWGSTLAEDYGACRVGAITLDFGGLQEDLNCALETHNITIRVSVVDDSGDPITSGLSLYLSGPIYNGGDVDGPSKDFHVSAGTYYIGANCIDYQNCSYSCISNETVSVSDGDALREVALTAKRNDAVLSGRVRGSDGSRVSGAYVSVGNYDYSGDNACYAYGFSMTDAGGSFTVNMPAGNYTVWVYPPGGDAAGGGGSSYAPNQESVTLTAGRTTSKNIELRKKDATISGVASDSNGNPISGTWVNAWVNGNGLGDYAYTQTAEDGSYSLSVIRGYKYNLQAFPGYIEDSNISPCSSEGMRTVKAPASNVDFTFAIWDQTTTFVLVDADGNMLSTVNGGGSIRTASSSEEDWCGTWVNFDNGVGSVNLGASLDYLIEPNVWGGGEYDPAESSIAFTTGGAGSSKTVEVEMIPVNATISGGYVDADGHAVEPDSDYLSIDARRGNLWRYCGATRSGYSCSVSAGKWCLSYWLDWDSSFASLPPGSSSACVNVRSGGSATQDLVFLKTGYVDVTVKDNGGNPMAWAWVDFDTQPADEHGTDDEGMFWGNGCSTDSEGRCTAIVGASDEGTTYYIRAYRPWGEMGDEDLTLPEEVSVVALPGATVAAPELVFRVLDGEIAITLTASDADTGTEAMIVNPVVSSDASLAEEIISGAYVSCFSDTAGYSEATADESGTATIKCISGEVWHCFGISQLASKLYISENTDTTCVSTEDGGTSATIALNYVGPIPDAVSQSWQNTQANTIALSDGASLSIPANAAGEDGAIITCTMQPDAILPYQAGKRPTCFYGYDINCTDANGAAVTQFNADISICMPQCDDQQSALDLETSDLSVSYRDTSTDSYIPLTDVTVDEDADLICGKTNHFTEFAIVGNGNLDAQGGTPGDTGNTDKKDDIPTGAGADSSSGGGCGCSVDGKASAPNVLVVIVGALVCISAIVFARRGMKRARK
jgi:protocatechuate 3,4-dioxygenase beta subunit